MPASIAWRGPVIASGVPATNYTVRINNGGNVQVVSGQLTGGGDQGNLGDGITVATFTRSTGGSITAFAVPPSAAVKAPGGKP